MKNTIKKTIFMMGLVCVIFLTNSGIAMAAGSCIAVATSGHHTMDKAIYYERIGRQIPSPEPGYIYVALYDVYLLECSACGYQDGSTKEVYVCTKRLSIG